MSKGKTKDEMNQIEPQLNADGFSLLVSQTATQLARVDKDDLPAVSATLKEIGIDTEWANSEVLTTPLCFCSRPL